MAFYTRLTIINGVLAQLARTPVSTVNENDDAKIISDQLDRLLPLFQKTTLNWLFLRKDIKLTTPLNESLSIDWQTTFVVPPDYLRIVSATANTNFEIRGRYIFTNSSTFEMTYLQFVDDYALFEEHFIDYFTYYCAEKLAIPLTRDGIIYENVKNMLMESKIAAQATEQRLKTGRRTLLNPLSRMYNNAR